MDTRDMSIMSYDEMVNKVQQKPEDKKHYVEIDPKHAGIMSGMNRKERRKYWSINRKDIEVRT